MTLRSVDMTSDITPDHEILDDTTPVEDRSIEVGLGNRVRALRHSRGM